jgi:hypothetical protein
MSEEKLGKEKTLERLEVMTELASNISLLVTIFVFFVFGAQLLGINMNYILWLIITFKWYIPEWVLEKYYGVFYGMAWALLLLMLWDSIYQNLYTRRHGEPNPRYAYYSSIIMFSLSFILSIAFHIWLFYFTAIMSGFTFMYILLGPTSGTSGGASW